MLCVLLGVMDVRRGSLAWLWRQTHDLESMSLIKRGPEVAGSNPAPGTKIQGEGFFFVFFRFLAVWLKFRMVF